MPPQPALLTTRILWFALLMATFIYMAVAYLVLNKPPATPPQPIMPLAFGFLSLTITGASFFVPRMVYQNTAKVMQVKIEEEVAPSAFPDRYREAMQRRKVFAEPRAAAKTAFICFQTPFILSIALSEAIALFGLVLAALGFEVSKSLPFFVLGTILVAIRFPSQARILSMFEHAKGASFPAANR